MLMMIGVKVAYIHMVKGGPGEQLVHRYRVHKNAVEKCCLQVFEETNDRIRELK